MSRGTGKSHTEPGKVNREGGNTGISFVTKNSKIVEAVGWSIVVMQSLDFILEKLGLSSPNSYLQTGQNIFVVSLVNCLSLWHKLMTDQDLHVKENDQHCFDIRANLESFFRSDEFPVFH